MQVSSTDNNGMKDARQMEGDKINSENLENQSEVLAKLASYFWEKDAESTILFVLNT